MTNKDLPEQPAKALSDEWLESWVSKAYARADQEERPFDSEAVLGALKEFRDQGYLSPSPGLTVEEVMAIVKPWVAKNTDDGDVIWSMLPEEKEVGMSKYECDLRTRLEAAIKAKTP